jgi:uroporphyrin-III C-methyltransferase
VTETGKVFLVGAGPGDPDLLTVKARKIFDQVDVVVYDRLVSDEIMALVPTGTSRINVGKQPSFHPVPQSEINQILVSLAKEGRNVMRLKGGDPFMFGRGSEEAAHLFANGVPYTVIPGITSASACAASVGLPLTHRGYATGARFITGHCCADSELDWDWRGLSDPNTTLVIYMGVANLPQITAQLIENGLSASTPIAAINNGTRPNQQCLISNLATVSEDLADQQFDGPVLFIIGRVVELTKTLGFNHDRTSERAELELERA